MFVEIFATALMLFNYSSNRNTITNYARPDETGVQSPVSLENSGLSYYDDGINCRSIWTQNYNRQSGFDQSGFTGFYAGYNVPYSYSNGGYQTFRAFNYFLYDDGTTGGYLNFRLETDVTTNYNLQLVVSVDIYKAGETSYFHFYQLIDYSTLNNGTQYIYDSYNDPYFNNGQSYPHIPYTMYDIDSASPLLYDICISYVPMSRDAYNRMTINGDDNYALGYETGYSDGVHDGYAEGSGDANHYTFFRLFGAIADTPIMILRNLLGFEVFGVEAIHILMSMITGVIVLWIIRRVVF